MAKVKSGEVWEDKKVLFDLPFTYLRLRPGEKVFDRIEPIEDTKGNSGTRGRMVVTNLRVVWHTAASTRINLSIGLHCVLSTSTRVVSSGLRGATQALHMDAVYKASRYEFVFTNLAPDCVRHYTSVAAVHKAYGASRMYRDLKLRSPIISNNTLRVLPLEKICLREENVWNLSAEAGHLGTLLLTDVRVVWFADLNHGFNVSMPYITIESITSRESKFGSALVFAVRAPAPTGGYLLGFRVEPPRADALLAELQALHRAYNEAPIFGVRIDWDLRTSQSPTDDIEEMAEIGEPRGEMGPNLYLASQLAQSSADARRSAPAPVYSPYLGLAIQPLAEGFTLQSLIQVQTKK